MSYRSEGYLSSYQNSSSYTSSRDVLDDDYGLSYGLKDTIASSVASRGIMFSNPQPLTGRWLPLRGPVAALADKAQRENLANVKRYANVKHKFLPKDGSLPKGFHL